jgi:hypothetical protein
MPAGADKRGAGQRPAGFKQFTASWAN